jgi:hypothetical protein
MDHCTKVEHSSRFLSSNKDFSSQDALSSQICVASTGFQNQASEKPASNLEVGSHTQQLEPPISNMVIDSHVSSLVRAQSSNTRNLSTHPIETSLQSTSRNVAPLCNDPFCNQLETIRKHDEQNVKTRNKWNYSWNIILRRKWRRFMINFRKSARKQLT